MMRLRLFNLLSSMAWISVLVAVSGCTTTTSPKSDPLAAFHETRPKSILILPVVNQSVDVRASTSVLTTLPRMLAEKGYYVFPVNTVKTLLEFEGLYEPAEIHDAPPDQLAELFGADAILYVTIHRWTAEYVVLKTRTVVDFEYRITNREGTQLWSARKELSYAPETSSSGSTFADIVVSAVSAALERADPNYLPLTRQANKEVFYQDRPTLPPGPYSPKYEEYYSTLESE